jgi:transcriptional regulator with XRE-family HTH domain
MIYRLKEARKMNCMTLRSAAKGLGISHEELRKFETGKLKIDSGRLIVFSKFYNVPIDYLVPNKNRPVVKLKNIHWARLPKCV